jgi:hypothetical protein
MVGNDPREGRPTTRLERWLILVLAAVILIFVIALYLVLKSGGWLG